MCGPGRWKATTVDMYAESTERSVLTTKYCSQLMQSGRYKRGVIHVWTDTDSTVTTQPLITAEAASVARGGRRWASTGRLEVTSNLPCCEWNVYGCNARLLIGSAALRCGHWKKLHPALYSCCCCSSPRGAVCCHGDHGHAGPNKATGNICIIATSAHKEVRVVAAAPGRGSPPATPSFTSPPQLWCYRVAEEAGRSLALESTAWRTEVIRLTFWPPACNQCFCRRGESQSPWWLRVWSRRPSQTLWRWARWSTAEPQLDPKAMKMIRQLQQ